MSTVVAPRAALGPDGATAVAVPVWRLALASFAAPERRPRLQRWLGLLPVLGVLALQAAMTLRLRNTPYEDEALYLHAGHQILGDLSGTLAGDGGYGAYFSGLPWAYPPVAAALDDIGGLPLARGLSLVCLLVATLCVRRTARSLWGEGASGDLAALVFVLSGQVAYLGALATFDAPCVMLLAAALALGVSRRGVASGAAVGLLLALAVTLKYTCVVFVPVVLAVVLLARPRGWARVLVAGATAAGGAALVYLLLHQQIAAGVAFTTASRAALYHVGGARILGVLARDVGVLLLLALGGAVLTVRSSTRLRTVLLVAAILAGGVGLSLGQLRLGEFVSLEKHVVYGVLFLSLLAARLLAALRRRPLGVLLVAVATIAYGTQGLYRSEALHGWPDVSPVVTEALSDPLPGRYLSFAAWSPGYYTESAAPQIAWTQPYSLFDGGEEAMEGAVARRDFRFVALQDTPSGNARQDEETAFFRRAMLDSGAYVEVARHRLAPYSRSSWVVYRLRSDVDG